MVVLNSNPMILRNRNELKSLFKNKSHLSETHFAVLIESMLNKSDDQFHGRWKAGRLYRQGDVVIHAGALWEMTTSTEICSHDAPETDPLNWASLMQAVQDLMAEREQMRQEIQALQTELMAYQQQTNDLLQHLTNRIEQLEQTT